MDSRFVAQVVSRDPQLSVILYESSSGRELNMNEWILNQVAETADWKPFKVFFFVQFQKGSFSLA